MTNYAAFEEAGKLLPGGYSIPIVLAIAAIMVFVIGGILVRRRRP